MILTDDNFEAEVINSDKPVLVDFYADWCGPCKMISPVIQAVSNEYAGKLKVGKVNVDENGETAMKYRVMSIPTLILFKDGKTVNRIEGAVPQSVIEEHINKII